MNTFWKGLLAALIGGAVGPAAQVALNKATGQSAIPVTAGTVGSAAAAGAAIAVVAYLTKSPLQQQ